MPAPMPGDAPSAREQYDAMYMRRCLELARRALATGDVPVGSIVVRDGRVIGEGVESTREHLDPTAHAEIEALRAACRTLGTLDLSTATLYSTVEPCVICAYAVRYAQIRRVVFGTNARTLGGATGPCPLLTSAMPIGGSAPPAITTGILSEDCEHLLAERRAP
ncbi:MAG TPA: nucleoside deaminase [Gemmatimonadaceae bacterium]|nr:nucleoside deaminase [Gemmatimonadaceae bacterium]